MKRRRDDYKKSVEQHFLVKDNIRTAHDRHILEEVSKDAPRTAPQLEIFSNKRMQNSIERILFLWAIRHPASSYVQGKLKQHIFYIYFVTLNLLPNTHNS